MSQPGLLWFLARFEEAARAGHAADAAWICRDHPEHLAVVQHALEQLGHLAPMMPVHAATLVGLPAALTTDFASTPQQATLTGSPRGKAGEAHAPPSYQILDVLGRGGMGVVYRARQISLDRIVALKMILAGRHAQAEDEARFFTEAETLAALQHPNIIQVYEFGKHEGLPFLAMELCPGGSLGQKLAGSPLSPREAATLLAQLARAIQAAHDAGVVHRDLKPANILLARDGSPRITDFGLAKRLESESHLTATGALLGTPSYMAPEQAQASKHTGPPADIYSLGAMLYECLTGRPPFKGATAMETLQQVVGQEPVSIRHLQPKVPRDLETICHMALRKEPERRYPQAADMADDLDRFLKGEPVRARPVGLLERGWKWVRRWPLITGLVAAFVLSLVTGTVVSTRLAYVAHQRLDLAKEREVEVRDALDVAGRISLLLVSNALAPVEPREVLRDHDACLGLSAGEVTALEELAHLPPAIDRVHLLERVLDDPVATRKLSWRLRPVLRALLGLDDERRRAVLALVAPKVKDRSIDPTVRLVCARITARLWTPEDAMRKEAGTVILDALRGKMTAGERMVAVTDLPPLAEMAEPATAAWMCERLVEVAREADPVLLERLAQACRAAGARLEAGQRRDREMAQVLVRRLRQCMENKSDLNTLLLFVRAFAVVGDRLERDEASGGLRTLVDLARASGRPAEVEAAVKVFGVVAGRLDAAEASGVAVEVAEEALKLVPATARELLLGGLDAALDETLPRVIKADAARLAKPFAEAVERSEGAERLLLLNEAFNRVANDMPVNDRARVAEELVARLMPLMHAATDLNHGRLLTEAVALTVKVLPPEKARALAEGSPLWGDKPLSSAQLESACVVAGALMSPRVAERAEERIRRHPGKTAADVRHLARALAGVAKALPVRRAEALAEELQRRIETLAADTTTAAAMLRLADGFVALAGLLPAGERHRTATMLMERVLAVVPPQSSPADLRELRLTLEEVSPWVEPAVLARESARYAPVVIREVAEQHWVQDVETLLRAVTESLPAAELVALLGQPTCVGPAEEAVLRVLGRKAGRRFVNVWQVAAWAREKEG